MAALRMQLRGMTTCMGRTRAAAGTATMAPPMPVRPETKPPANQQRKTMSEVVSMERASDVDTRGGWSASERFGTDDAELRRRKGEENPQKRDVWGGKERCVWPRRGRRPVFREGRALLRRNTGRRRRRQGETHPTRRRERSGPPTVSPVARFFSYERGAQAFSRSMLQEEVFLSNRMGMSVPPRMFLEISSVERLLQTFLLEK